MDRQALKPPFAYYGGKMSIASMIAEMLPEHEHYVEPFAGSLAVLLAKGPSRAVVLSGYDAPLYADLFDGWHRMDLQGATTLSGETNRVEVLWSNRPLGEPDLFGGVA